MSTLGLIEVIHWLEDALDRLALQRSYGGAIAYNYYGPPRLTQDVDILVLTRDMMMPALVEELRRAGCVHDDRDGKPVDLRTVLDDLRGRTHYTVFLYAGVRIEMFVPWHAFHRRVLTQPGTRTRGATHPNSFARGSHRLQEDLRSAEGHRRHQGDAHGPAK